MREGLFKSPRDITEGFKDSPRFLRMEVIYIFLGIFLYFLLAWVLKSGHFTVVSKALYKKGRFRKNIKSEIRKQKRRQK